MFWIHSHVRGCPCGLSSIDVHTQYAYQLEYPQILSLVVELNEDGKTKDFDFFELTENGQSIVKHCSKNRNCSSIQHESCGTRDIYSSCSNRVMYSDSLKIKVHDFSEIPSQQLSEKQINWNNCKSCQKEFKNILLHLSKNDICKKTYGSEFHLMKELKAKEKQLYAKNYQKKNSEKIRKRKQDFFQSNKEAIDAKRRKIDDEAKKEKIMKHKIYNDKNREDINRKQKQYNANNQDKIAQKQRMYNKEHRKVNILRAISFF